MLGKKGSEEGNKEIVCIADCYRTGVRNYTQKSQPGDFLTYLKICIGFIKLLLLIWTKNCFGSLVGMEGLGKSASASRAPGSISVDRVPVLPNGDT